MNSILLIMVKVKLLFLTNVGLFFSFLDSAVSGFWRLFFLPRSGELRRALKVVHNYSGPVFTLLVIIHLILNWGWIKTKIKK